LREGKKLSKNKIWEIHQIYGEKAGVKLTPYMWRHTGITEYAKKEKDLEIVRRQSRHEDINTTRRYINYASEIFENSYHEKFAGEKQEEKPETQKTIKPKIEPKPEDNYIANPEPTDISINPKEYKEFLQWKKQRDMMFGQYRLRLVHNQNYVPRIQQKENMGSRTEE
jgi:hypothetical protein